MDAIIATVALVAALIALVLVVCLWRHSATRWSHSDFAERLTDRRLLQHGREIGALRRKYEEPGS